MAFAFLCQSRASRAQYKLLQFGDVKSIVPVIRIFDFARCFHRFCTTLESSYIHPRLTWTSIEPECNLLSWFRVCRGKEPEVQLPGLIRRVGDWKQTRIARPNIERNIRNSSAIDRERLRLFVEEWNISFRQLGCLDRHRGPFARLWLVSKART